MNTVSNETMNGSRIVVLGCACVVFSCLTPDEIRRFKAYQPDALKLKDGDTGETVFSIGIDNNGPGSLLPDAATFGRLPSADGKATITIILDPDIDDPMDAVKSMLGQPLMRLVELEAQLVQLLPELKEEEKRLDTRITQL